MTRTNHLTSTLTALTVAGGCLLLAPTTAQADDHSFFGLTIRVGDSHGKYDRYNKHTYQHKSHVDVYRHPHRQRHTYQRYHRSYHVHRPPVTVHRPVVVQRPVVVERHVTQRVEPPRVVYVEPKYQQHHTPPVAVNGWHLLADGHAYAALESFAAKATAKPDRGGPKIGVAIANSMLGRHGKATFAMRRAVTVDPNAVLRVPAEGKLAFRLKSLAFGLEYGHHVTTDDLFLAASLRMVAGDVQGAHHTLARVERLGCTAASTRTLRHLINAQLYHPR